MSAKNNCHIEVEVERGVWLYATVISHVADGVVYGDQIVASTNCRDRCLAAYWEWSEAGGLKAGRDERPDPPFVPKALIEKMVEAARGVLRGG